MENSYIGKKVDNRYDVISLIGVGGMSNVYKAIDTLTGDTVAIKFLKEEFFDNEELVRRFKNESKAISLLNHPNIIKVIDVNIADDEKYIVVEYIDGITLKEYIDNRKVLTWQETVQFTSVILAAIGHAHKNGIIHRDLKPQNIMLLRDGTLKIMDFGIARLSTANQKTVTDKAIGSVHYISPEQVRGKSSDGRSDIYSIGIMMYEMLTGTLPFVSDTAVSVAMKQVSDTAKNPSEIVDTIPHGLEQIVMKAIQKQPDERYQTAEDMLNDIKEFKSNPAVVFPYDDEDKTQTVMVESLKNNKEKKNKVKVKKGFRLTFPIMAGITLAFVLSSMLAIYMIFKSNNSPLLTKYQDIELPNFVGMTESEVKNSDLGLKFDIEYVYSGEYEEGVVFSQTPKPPKTIKENGKIKLKVSKGPKETSLPNLSGYSRTEAQNILNDMDVDVSVKMVEDKNVKMGNVVKTEPEEGNIVRTGDTVIMYVSLGDGKSNRNMVSVVNVVGAPSIDDARKILAKNTLSVATFTKRESDQPEGTVIEQSPAAGEKVLAGTGINLVISSGRPRCPICGSTDHTVHPYCEICGSREHITEKHECELCGELGHGEEECPYQCPVHGSDHLASECPLIKPTPSPDVPDTSTPDIPTPPAPPAQ